MTPQEQSELDEILREVTGEFAAQYRLRNEAKEPYSIKIAENKAEAAIDEAKTALLAWRTKAIAEAENAAKAEAYDDCQHWLKDRLTSKKDVAEICDTRAKTLRGEIEPPKSRFAPTPRDKETL